MKRILTVLALVVLALPVPAVYASESIPVSGGMDMMYMGPPNVLDMKSAGNNVIWTLEITEEWYGDISGVSAPLKSIWAVHNYDPTSPFFGAGPDSPVNIHEILTLTNATFQGKSGSLTIELNIQSQNMAGHWRILSGGGDLANLRGGGTLGVMPDTYTGQVHFDP